MAPKSPYRRSGASTAIEDAKGWYAVRGVFRRVPSTSEPIGPVVLEPGAVNRGTSTRSLFSSLVSRRAVATWVPGRERAGRQISTRSLARRLREIKLGFQQDQLAEDEHGTTLVAAPEDAEQRHIGGEWIGRAVHLEHRRAAVPLAEMGELPPSQPAWPWHSSEMLVPLTLTSAHVDNTAASVRPVVAPTLPTFSPASGKSTCVIRKVLKRQISIDDEDRRRR